MTRKNKNIIMCLGLIILVILLFFTVGGLKTNADALPDKMNFGNFAEKNIPSDFKENGPGRKRYNEGVDDNVHSNDESPGGKFNPEDMPDFDEIEKKFTKDKNMPKNNISTVKYIFIGIESLGISLIAMYLVMSNFNNKSFKEVIENKYNIIIYILSTIIITTTIIYGSNYIANGKNKNYYPEINERNSNDNKSEFNKENEQNNNRESAL